MYNLNYISTFSYRNRKHCCLNQWGILTNVFESHKCALPESVFPVPYKFWQFCGGVNGDLLQEGLCHTQVYCTQTPCPWSSPLLTCTSSGGIQTQFCLSLCRIWFLVGTRYVWVLWASLMGMGFDSKRDFTLPTILLGLLLCPWEWGISSLFYRWGNWGSKWLKL